MSTPEQQIAERMAIVEAEQAERRLKIDQAISKKLRHGIHTELKLQRNTETKDEHTGTS